MQDFNYFYFEHPFIQRILGFIPGTHTKLPKIEENSVEQAKSEPQEVVDK